MIQKDLLLNFYDERVFDYVTTYISTLEHLTS